MLTKRCARDLKKRCVLRAPNPVVRRADEDGAWFTPARGVTLAA